MPNDNKKNPSRKMIYAKLLELENHVTENYTNIKWLKDLYKSVSNRQWLIATGIVVTILLVIADLVK